MNRSSLTLFFNILLLSPITAIVASESIHENENKAPLVTNSVGAKIGARDNGTFGLLAGNLIIGEPTFTDPLFTGIPRDQTSFAISIPVAFPKKIDEAPSLVSIYQTATCTTMIGQTLTSGPNNAQIEACEISFSGVSNLGFIINIGFFVHGENFLVTDLNDIIHQLAILGFAINIISSAEEQSCIQKIEEAGILTTTTASNGSLEVVAGAFTIGLPTVVDPLVVNLPNNQSAFGLRIPITFNSAVNPLPIIVSTYRSTLAKSLVGKILHGIANAFVENVEVSVSNVTSNSFSLNIGFFTFFDPGFNNGLIGSLLSQLATSGFGANLVWKN